MLKSLRRIECYGISLLLLALACGVSCQRVAPPQTTSTTTTSAPPQYARIISLSPSTTEVLYGLGLFPRIVAVSDYDEYPPEVKTLPRIGGWSNTNLEQVASLRPDLIVLTQSQAPFIKDKVEALGIKTLVVPSYTVADVLTGIEQIGRTTGREQAAQALIAETRAKLADVRARTSGSPRVRVLCIVDRKGVSSRS
jgi:iron complex transport system substrate-binding protein